MVNANQSYPSLMRTCVQNMSKTLPLPKMFTVMDAGKLCLHSSLLILQFLLCTSKDTITINQTIKEGNLLVSKENNFALGFFSSGSSSYRYLGIWFHKVARKTVVWVANRNDPIDGSSGVLSINQYGNLILQGNHQQKVPIWSTNVSVGARDTCAAQLQLLDSGNLVLVQVQGRSKRIVWQSFDYPTNIMLQGMKLGLNRKTGMDRFLTSWRSADDLGTGNYSFKLNPSGSPQFFLYNSNNPHWRSVPWPWRGHLDVQNYSFVNNQDEIYFTYFHDASVTLIFVLDDSGSFKWLKWHERDGQWKELWSVPKYRCDLYGNCGANSKCDPNKRPSFECNCLPGYEPKSPRDWYLRDGSGGCVRKRLESSLVCGQGEGFVKVADIKVPDTSAAVWADSSMNPGDCKQECMRNCSCTAYATIKIPGKGSGCLQWYGELMDTHDYLEDGDDLYIRVDAIELAENMRKSNGSLETKQMLAILIPSVVSALFVIVMFVYLRLRKRKKKVNTKRTKRLLDHVGGSNNNKDTLVENEPGESTSHPDWEFFNISTISAATNKFSPANKLGQGGFGSVYKGKLSNGQKIAIKRLSKNSGQGIEEFRNEVLLIAKLQHRNLVKLLGCCIEGGEHILVYEYLTNKSLDSFLFDQTTKLFLDWRKRFHIIIGIARGILYLHQDSRLRIIHRDLKCSNILLDAEMNPKISDFGMARIFKGDQITDKTDKVVGTYGYMSPEYAAVGKYSVKSDVFSFGVILLEIVSGHKNNSFYSQDPSLTLTGHVWELWKEGKALEIVDSSVKESYHSHEALRCIQIGLLCVQEDAMDRPTMSAVVLMLNSEATLPSPKQPAFILRESCNNPKSPLGEEGPCSVNELTITGVITR